MFDMRFSVKAGIWVGRSPNGGAGATRAVRNLARLPADGFEMGVAFKSPSDMWKPMWLPRIVGVLRWPQAANAA